MSKNGLKSVYFTSDLHVGHDSCILFDNRPFRDMDHMIQVLVNNFNSTVKPGSVVYYLGDIGFGKGEIIRQYLSLLVEHTKVLCLGNHDRGSNAMYNLGFDVVLYGAKLQIAKQIVSLSHCPLLDTYREDTSSMIGSVAGEPWHGNTREKHRTMSFSNEGQYHLHGHIHSPNKGRSRKTLDRQYDVGVVSNNYRPVSISTIESWITKTLREEEK